MFFKIKIEGTNVFFDKKTVTLKFWDRKEIFCKLFDSVAHESLIWENCFERYEKEEVE